MARITIDVMLYEMAGNHGTFSGEIGLSLPRGWRYNNIPSQLHPILARTKLRIEYAPEEGKLTFPADDGSAVNARILETILGSSPQRLFEEFYARFSTLERPEGGGSPDNLYFTAASSHSRGFCAEAEQADTLLHRRMTADVDPRKLREYTS